MGKILFKLLTIVIYWLKGLVIMDKYLMFLKDIFTDLEDKMSHHY